MVIIHRFPDGLCGVRVGAHARLLQRLLLVPRHLHPPHPVLGPGPPQHRPQLRHADGQAPTTPAAQTQPPTGVSPTTGRPTYARCALTSL